MKLSKELVKGSTAMLVLSVVAEKDMYGYQIIRELEVLSEEVFSMNEGTLYPILHSLEKEGFLEAYWEENASARKRRYYRMTEKGRRELESRKKEWNTYAQAVIRVIQAGC